MSGSVVITERKLRLIRRNQQKYDAKARRGKRNNHKKGRKSLRVKKKELQKNKTYVDVSKIEGVQEVGGGKKIGLTGEGLFAKRSFKKYEECVAFSKPREINKQEYESLKKNVAVDVVVESGSVLYVDDDVLDHLDCHRGYNSWYKMNNSKQPNVTAHLQYTNSSKCKISKTILFKATRHIHPGEELTWEYNVDSN